MLTSYAQNFEDVILWRALGHIERGFYIDIGAWDPVTDSISLAFYEKGWRGLHVEPEPRAAARLREARRDEEVLEVAIGPGDGPTSFYAISGSGLSTCDAAMAERHASNGYAVEQISVPSVPLREILERARDREVHWLKIDVEGMECEVIRGWLPSSVRPWLVVVEVVSPYASGVDRPEWESQLLGLGYEFVYFDGLNRFYLSSAHPELRRHFGPGPSIFDNFALGGLASSPFCSKMLNEHRAAQIEGSERLRAVELREAALGARCDDLGEAVATLGRCNSAMSKSLAWSRKELRRSRRMLWREQARCSILEAKHHELARQLEAAESTAATLESRVHALWAAADRARRELSAMHESNSWRLTAPLRWAIRCAHACAGRSLRAWRTAAQAPTLLGVLLIDRTAAIVRRRPRLKRGLLLAVGLVPGLRNRAVKLAINRGSASALASKTGFFGLGAISNDVDCEALPASARQVYVQISRARAIHSSS